MKAGTKWESDCSGTAHSKCGKSSPGAALLGDAHGCCVCGSSVPLPGEKALKWKHTEHMNERVQAFFTPVMGQPPWDGTHWEGRQDRWGGNTV